MVYCFVRYNINMTTLDSSLIKKKNNKIREFIKLTEIKIEQWYNWDIIALLIFTNRIKVDYKTIKVNIDVNGQIYIDNKNGFKINMYNPIVITFY